MVRGFWYHASMPTQENKRCHNWTGKCEHCDKQFSKYHRASLPTPRFCSLSCRNRATSELPHVKKIRSEARSGVNSNWWKGDSVSDRSGRSRALRKYKERAACEACGSQKSERHHKDGNTRNNAPENIARLCRKCHMIADGRLEAARRAMGRLQKMGVSARWTKRSKKSSKAKGDGRS